MTAENYSARHLSVLEGLEAVRKRPGMYIGTTDSRGLMHCLWEVIDNSVDEALGGYGKEIEIILHADDSVEVRDRGRGIPVDIEPKTGLSGVEVVMTKLHAGGKFGGGSYAASGGLHGVGASVVNALSERLDVWVDRGGMTHHMAFRRGEPGYFADPAQGPTPDAPFTPFVTGSELTKAGKVARGVTGTRTRYWADRQIFSKGAQFAYDELITRARQTAFLVPGLTLVVEDRRGPEPVKERFHYQGGAKDFVDFIAKDNAVTDTWELTGTGAYSETVPVLKGNGQLVSEEVQRECQVDVALRWGTGYETDVRSFVNIISTPKGGTHLAGFEQGLVKVLRKTIEANARRLKITARGRRRAHREGRHPRGAHGRRHGAHLRAAVRGPDQGGARHRSRARDRGSRGGDRACRASEFHQARHQGAVGYRAREDRERDARARLGAQAEGDLAPKERARDLVAAGKARRLPLE